MNRPLGPDLDTPIKPWQFPAYELRLDLSTVDATRCDGLRRGLARRGVRFTTLARERDRDPAAIELAYALHSECHRRQPPVALRQTPIPFHLWSWGSLEARDEALPDAYFIAVAENRYVGLTTAVRIRRLPGVLECRFTGVLPEYRGRGIGLALKAQVVRYGIHHGYRELRSTVFAENEAMLRINEALGFERHRAFIQSYPQLMTPELLRP